MPNFRADSLAGTLSVTSRNQTPGRLLGVIGPEKLRNWLVKYRATNGGTDTDLTTPERARLKESERENQHLGSETVLLKKPALPSRGSSGSEQLRIH